MALTAGIVGLPNVGKSTLFNAITKAGAEAANYPFATIDPNVGVVEVPDSRLNRLTELVTPIFEKWMRFVTLFVVSMMGILRTLQAEWIQKQI